MHEWEAPACEFCLPTCLSAGSQRWCRRCPHADAEHLVLRRIQAARRRAFALTRGTGQHSAPADAVRSGQAATRHNPSRLGSVVG
jgi:hypothetical protein